MVTQAKRANKHTLQGTFTVSQLPLQINQVTIQNTDNVMIFNLINKVFPAITCDNICYRLIKEAMLDLAAGFHFCQT